MPACGVLSVVNLMQAPAQDEGQNGFSASNYDSALVDARALRAELEGGLKQYRARNDSLIKQMNMLHARLQRKNPTVQAVEELKQAQIQVSPHKRLPTAGSHNLHMLDIYNSGPRRRVTTLTLSTCKDLIRHAF